MLLYSDTSPKARAVQEEILSPLQALTIAQHAPEGGPIAEALARLAESVPDVLLSDIGLPGEDGYELIRAVRARGHTAAALPAIALTAYARREDQRLALQAGFQAHVAKPVEPTILVSAVAEAALLASRK